MDLPEQQLLIVQHEQRAVCVVGQGHWLTQSECSVFRSKSDFWEVSEGKQGGRAHNLEAKYGDTTESSLT
jgi:hypothetical protein